MKNFTKIIFFASIFLLLFSACEEEDNNIEALENWMLSEATLDYPETDASIVLERENRDDVIRFEWEKPTSERDYLITYEWLLDKADGDFSEPLLMQKSADNGLSLFVEVPYFKIDQALENAGIPPSESASTKWAVRATSVSKTSMTASSVVFTRFDSQGPPPTLYLGGNATEAGNDIEAALYMKRLQMGDGTETNVFEIYSSLTGGETYNFYSTTNDDARVFTAEGETITSGSEGIVAPESGEYRITVDFDAEKLSLYKIDYWSVVGNVIKDGWGGDEPLAYQGNGVWESSVQFLDADPGDTDKRFIFRANGDWGQVLKQINGSQNELALEATKDDLGIAIDDIRLMELKKYKVRITLNGEGYVYELLEDTSSGETPEKLFLFADGSMSAEFTKSGDAFSYEFLDLDPSVNYILNSENDGTGISYTIAGTIGESSKTGDNISESVTLQSGNASLPVNKSQAYQLVVDFAAENLTWKYYNFKLFHWDDWDGRQELTMDYTGNFTWEITTYLDAGKNSKFITPWDYQMGGADPAALNGDLVSNGGEDINNVSESGSYKVTMVLDSKFAAGTYSFVKQ
ncbi:SusE domain-containing protein [Galbibacter sp. BG1]|uniref:SusE domain-containing protein n=1 Tax=Galbibacter sp. BG1 TaxID=1170699 RepID=UPI0015BCDD4F|nr:SusE domain-containing protein [Galbibacter sp. BG1]QLE01269.1 SusE domain-containing protein [Galbibacter sp. BG1]